MNNISYQKTLDNTTNFNVGIIINDSYQIYHNIKIKIIFDGVMPNIKITKIIGNNLPFGLDISTDNDGNYYISGIATIPNSYSNCILDIYYYNGLINNIYNTTNFGINILDDDKIKLELSSNPDINNSILPVIDVNGNPNFNNLKLLCDLNITNEASITLPFNSTFDGNNKTITYNGNINAFFNKTVNSTISNLNITAKTINNIGGGGLLEKDSHNVYIKDITFNGDLIMDESGGIIGSNCSSIKLYNCTFNGIINSKNSGGLIGSNCKYIECKDCVVNGDINRYESGIICGSNCKYINIYNTEYIGVTKDKIEKSIVGKDCNNIHVYNLEYKKSNIRNYKKIKKYIINN